MPKMPKTFVLDTNVLLHNPRAMYVFEENEVVIPLAVIEEIDNQKRRQDEIGLNAREVSRILDDLRLKGNLAQGVDLERGGTLRIEVNHQSLKGCEDRAEALDAGKPDNRILAVALNLARKEDAQVTLVSKDLNLRLKADVLGIEADDFTNDKVDFTHLYSGQGEMMITSEELSLFYQDKVHTPERVNGFCPHQFVVLKAADNPSGSALGRVAARLEMGIEALSLPAGQGCFGLKPRNKEQSFALELLLDPEVKVVTLAGGAGTGKTLLALAAGLEQVVETGAFAKLLVTRPVIPMEGQDLGYLPGDKEEKIRPWMQPIYDNLEYLFGRSHSRPRPGGLQKNLFKGGEHTMGAEDYLSYTGQMEMEALTYIRGRSIPNQFILVDEAQNCTTHAIKTLLTRVGEGSKIVFTGDIDQIDHPYLDSASNGFTILVERLKHSEKSGHITLLKGERSEIAQLGADLL